MSVSRDRPKFFSSPTKPMSILLIEITTPSNHGTRSLLLPPMGNNALAVQKLVRTKCSQEPRNNKNKGRKLKRETESVWISCLKFILGTRKKMCLGWGSMRNCISWPTRFNWLWQVSAFVRLGRTSKTAKAQLSKTWLSYKWMSVLWFSPLLKELVRSWDRLKREFEKWRFVCNYSDKNIEIS